MVLENYNVSKNLEAKKLSWKQKLLLERKKEGGKEEKTEWPSNLNIGANVR